MADLTNGSSVFQTYDNSGTGVAELGDNYAGKAFNGLSGKLHVLTVGVGGGAISQAQFDGFIRGITRGASLQNNDTTPDVFTVVGTGAFAATSSTSVVIIVQGTGTPSTTTGDYFANATVAITATVDQIPA
jgi:hypothetical protein